MLRMSQGVGDGTLEGAIVCKTLSYLPAGIGNNAIVVFALQQRCSHGGRRWAGPPSTDNFRPALQLKNRLPPTTKFPPKLIKN